MDHQHDDQVFEDPQPLPDKNQSWWQLAAIQSSAFGIPVLMVGRELTRMDGLNSALLSILIGNLILWLVGLGTVAMAYPKRKNAIQNLRAYVGGFGSILGGITLLAAFLFWYSLQIRYTLSEAKIDLSQLNISSDGVDIRLGVVLGLLTSLLALGGIRLIKWISIVLFPFILIFIIYSLCINNAEDIFKGKWTVSLSGIGLVIGLGLSGRVNFPTFFRHGKSASDNFLAISITAITFTFFNCAGCYLGGSNPEGFFGFISKNLYGEVLVAAFLLAVLVSINLVNIYFASAAWEAIVPKIKGNKKLSIVGMGGTIAFTFFQIKDPLLFIENIVDSFIGSLGAIILMMFVIKKIIRHRERKLEQLLSLLCWLIGCIVAIRTQIYLSLEGGKSFFANIGITFFSGIGTSILAFLLLMFIEETSWSAINSFKKRI